MRDPRFLWAVGLGALLALLPLAFRALAAGFPDASLVVLVPLSLYYDLPAGLFGDTFFRSGNLGTVPRGPMGHAAAATTWGAVGAAIGYANGRWHRDRRLRRAGRDAGPGSRP